MAQQIRTPPEQILSWRVLAIPDRNAAGVQLSYEIATRHLAVQLQGSPMFSFGYFWTWARSLGGVRFGPETGRGRGSALTAGNDPNRPSKESDLSNKSKLRR